MPSNFKKKLLLNPTLHAFLQTSYLYISVFLISGFFFLKKKRGGFPDGLSHYPSTRSPLGSSPGVSGLWPVWGESRSFCWRFFGGFLTFFGRFWHVFEMFWVFLWVFETVLGFWTCFWYVLSFLVGFWHVLTFLGGAFGIVLGIDCGAFWSSCMF